MTPDLAEIRRRWAVPPWIDGRSPELAADIAALLSELERLTSELAAARRGPVVEWRQREEMLLTFEEARKGLLCLRIFDDGWLLLLFPPGENAGVRLESGPETGDAGKAACEAAYRRAVGL